MPEKNGVERGVYQIFTAMAALVVAGIVLGVIIGMMPK